MEDLKLEALVNVLIEKGVITRKELQEELTKLINKRNWIHKKQNEDFDIYHR